MMPVKIDCLLSVKILQPNMPCKDCDELCFVIFNLFDSALSGQSPGEECFFIKCVLGCRGWPYHPMRFDPQQ